jgi:hypothetical protein
MHKNASSPPKETLPGAVCPTNTEAAAKVLDLNEVDAETERKRVQIQAGHLPRLHLASEKATAPQPAVSTSPEAGTGVAGESSVPGGNRQHCVAYGDHTEPGDRRVVVVDLSKVDAETEKKLVKVQAGVRGYLTRKHMHLSGNRTS